MTSNLLGFSTIDYKEFYALNETQSINKWNVHSHEITFEKEFLKLKTNNDYYTRNIFLSFDSKYLIVECFETKFKIKVYKSESLHHEIEMEIDYETDINVSSESYLLSYYSKNTLTLIDFDSKQTVTEIKGVTGNDENTNIFFLYSQFLSGSKFLIKLNKSVGETTFHIFRFYDSRNFKLIQAIEQTSSNASFSFNLQAGIVVSYSGSLSIQVLRFPQFTSLYEIKLSQSDYINEISFSPDNKMIAFVIPSKNCLKIYFIENGLEIYSYTEPEGISFPKFSADSKYIFYVVGQNFVRRPLVTYDSHLKIRSLINNLIKMEVPEELISLYSNDEFHYLMTKAMVYPLSLNILGFLARTSDLPSTRKLFKLCQLYNIYPILTLDFENKSAIDIAIEKKNLSLINDLVLFCFKTPQALHRCPAINVSTLTALLDLGVGGAPALLDSRFLDIPIEKPLVPLGIGDVFSGSFKSGFANKEDLLRLYNLYDEKYLNDSSLSLITPEFKILDLPGVLLPTSNFLEEVSELEVNNPIFQSRVLTAILDFKWRTYGRAQFLLRGFIQVLFLLVYTANTVYLAPCRLMDEGASYSWESWGICTKALFSIDIILLGAIFLYLVKEIQQIYSLSWRRYKRSLWNYIDFLIICLGIATLGLSITETLNPLPDQINILKALYGISTFFNWVRILDFLRGFSGTAFLIRILIQVFLDMRNFILILFLLLVAFSFSGKIKKYL
jgi:hypothetical protein